MPGVNTMGDLWAHPQLHARGRFGEVGSPVGPLPTLLPPGRTEATRRASIPCRRSASKRGDLLAELGYDGATIDALRGRRRDLTHRQVPVSKGPRPFAGAGQSPAFGSSGPAVPGRGSRFWGYAPRPRQRASGPWDPGT